MGMSQACVCVCPQEREGLGGGVRVCGQACIHGDKALWVGLGEGNECQRKDGKKSLKMVLRARQWGDPEMYACMLKCPLEWE